MATSHPGAETAFESLGTGRTDQPNIIFIMADDLGWADLGCYGSTAIRTPNLDRLASEGVRFTDGYSASPWCSPARIGLYTGRNPGRLPAGLHEPIRVHDEHNGIPEGEPTLPALLKAAGYDTAMFGKWHCGWLPWFSPIKIGFDRFFGSFDGAVDYFEHIDTLGEHDLWEGETPTEMVGYYTDILSEKTVEYLTERDERPFYVQLNYTAPHWPWEGRGDAAVGRRIRDDYENDTGHFFPLTHLDGGSLAKYAEMVEAMDEGIGQVLDALEASGLADNTLVLFCSDNGGERWSKNWPFVGEKGDITEGGIRVPLIVRWPAAIGAGQVSDNPNGMLDWTATMLDAGGVAHEGYALDGTSLLPWLVEGVPYPEHDLFWRVSSQSAIRRGHFKYVRTGRPHGFTLSWPTRPGNYEMLYDLSVDGRERADLRRYHPELVTELRTELDRMNAELLPYPDTHPGLPRRATADQPAVSETD